MRYLLDLNIWIDIAARPVMFPAAGRVLRKLEQLHQEVCFPLCSYTTLHYLLAQLLDKRAALDFTSLLRRRSVKFLRFSEDELNSALSLGFADHEDACVAATALSYRCNRIITRNTGDFRSSPVPAVSPENLLRELRLLSGKQAG